MDFDTTTLQLEDSVNDSNLDPENQATNCHIYSDRVEEAISGVLDKGDTFSKRDFNVIEYINQMFPTEQSLVGLDDAMAETSRSIDDTTREIKDILHTQAISSGSGRESLAETKVAIQQLFTHIRDIKAKTDSSEVIVKEITRDIKQLDTAKRNLTASITTLNHLHMMLGGVESMESFAKQRMYGDLANLLPGIIKVLEHFDRFMHIEQVKSLSDRVERIKSDAAAQILSDFQASTSSGRPFISNSKTMDACLVIDVIGGEVKKKFIDWFVELQLSEYQYLFEDSQDIAWLDRIDQRFAWFKKYLLEFETKLNGCFPPAWDMCQILASEFCRVTTANLTKLMTNRRRELTSSLVTYAINQSNDFEGLMARRFPNALEEQKKTTSEETPAARKNLFQGIIRKCFEPFLDVFIAAQDDALRNLVSDMASKYEKNGPPRPEGESGAITLQSASDLFMFYRKCILTATQVSLSNAILKDLARIFKKCLQDYANRCLIAFLPKVSTATSSGVTPGGIIQSLLKDGDTPRLTTQEQFTTCCVLLTAEYCAETTKQLQAKLSEKLTAQVDMSPEMDLYHLVVASCVQILVQDLETACDPAFSVMVKKQWSSVDVVGDESSYVHSIKMHLRKTIPRLRDYLISARKYFIQLCTKLASGLTAKFVASLGKCRPLSVTGAEQLLLDTHGLKTELLLLPNLESAAQRKPPSNYTTLITRSMHKAEIMLKLVMSSEDTVDTFVTSYLRLMPEGTFHDFQLILELKGLRRAEQARYVDVYHKRHALEANKNSSAKASPRGASPSPLRNDDLSNSGLSSPTPGSGGDKQDSGIKRLEKMVKKHPRS